MFILYALTIIFVIKRIIEQPIWLRHVATREDWRKIMVDGFAAPTNEARLLALDPTHDVDYFGQGGKDRVSFSFCKDTPYYEMRKWLINKEHNWVAEYQLRKQLKQWDDVRLIHGYIKLPVKDVIPSVALAWIDHGWGLTSKRHFGYSMEVNVDRDIVNDAVTGADGRFTFIRPDDYRSRHWVLVLDAFITSILGTNEIRMSQLRKSYVAARANRDK